MRTMGKSVGVWVVGGMLLAMGLNQSALAGKLQRTAFSSSSGSLSISGTPPASVEVGQTYAFQPAAAGREGQSLSFSVANKPAWAVFSISTGKLAGVPQAGQEGRYSSIVISASDGNKIVALPAFAIEVRAAVVANRAPQIGGAPLSQIKSAAVYSFQPYASDADGDSLSFSIANRPVWASFNAATGALSGVPTATQVGTYGNIAISVSDGRGGSATLPAFSITVVQSATGTAALTWTPPTQNIDGSALTDLAGYRVSYGTSAGGPYPTTVSVTNPSVSTHLVENLTAGTYYFVVTAQALTGAESPFSREVSKTIY